MFGCGSTNLARLANHLDQVHNMDMEERKKWLMWSKIGICVPRQSEEAKEFNVEKSLENLLRQQEEMERKFNLYLKAGTLQRDPNDKPRKHSKTNEKRKQNNRGTNSMRGQWLSL